MFAAEGWWPRPTNASSVLPAAFVEYEGIDKYQKAFWECPRAMLK
jgi:hypothetical protein